MAYGVGSLTEEVDGLRAITVMLMRRRDGRSDQSECKEERS
ncbi:hypothetical protein SALB1_2765 [Salinisphaera sp. LB1]|nr:hypothetical protein SALB1_2765 [Salinisphaera sp. LB1]